MNQLAVATVVTVVFAICKLGDDVCGVVMKATVK